MPGTEAFFFGSPARPLWGCLHGGLASATTGVVVCNPLGFEAISAHRSLRQLAIGLAQRGLPTLRFDYAGTGDSQGLDEGGDQVPHWLASIGEAIEALKARTGVSQVVLIGMRLGALLGARVAAERPDVAALAAWSPVWQGRRYVRELAALQAAMQAKQSPDVAAPAWPAAGDDDAIESGGFRFNGATARALQQLDLAALEGPHRPNLFWLDRDDLPPPAAAVLERVRSQGFAVEHACAGGWAEMMQEPQHTVVPWAALAVLTTWVGQCQGIQRVAAELPVPGRPRPASTPAAASAEPPFTERMVLLNGMKGVCSAPARGQPKVAVVVLNAGAIHRVGPNGMYVPLARQLAAQGALVLRLDLSGLGESPVRGNEFENTVYSRPAVADVLAAVQWIGEQAPGVPVRLLGLCSGGYHAFKAAVAGAPVDACVIINPLTFFWRPEMAAEQLLAPHRVSYMATQYLQRSLWSGKSWKKLLGGKVNLRVALRIIWRYGKRRLRDRAREVARAAKVPVRDDLAQELARAARQGTALHFIFATGDPGHALLLAQGGSMVERLLTTRQLTVRFVAGADHTFTPRWAQEQLQAQLVPLLLAPAASAAKVPRSSDTASVSSGRGMVRLGDQPPERL